jgi:uncharacterized CHY-type Zn-finger protein
MVDSQKSKCIKTTVHAKYLLLRKISNEKTQSCYQQCHEEVAERAFVLFLQGNSRKHQMQQDFCVIKFPEVSLSSVSPTVVLL